MWTPRANWPDLSDRQGDSNACLCRRGASRCARRPASTQNRGPFVNGPYAGTSVPSVGVGVLDDPALLRSPPRLPRANPHRVRLFPPPLCKGRCPSAHTGAEGLSPCFTQPPGESAPTRTCHPERSRGIFACPLTRSRKKRSTNSLFCEFVDLKLSTKCRQLESQKWELPKKLPFLHGLNVKRGFPSPLHNLPMRVGTWPHRFVYSLRSTN